MPSANWREPVRRESFDRQVTIQYRRDGTSTSEFPVDDWDTTRSRSVMMARQERARQDFRGVEKLNDFQVRSVAETRWIMGYREDMDPDLVDVTKDRRLVYQGRVMDITSGEHIGRKERIELTTIANPSGETA